MTVFKGKNDAYELWYDDNKWKISKGYQNPEASVTLAHTKGDAYTMVIFERISMPIGTLKNLTLEKAKEVAPDVEIILEEEKVVNGVKILNLRTEGTIQGIPFTYYGYYWTGESGSLQVIAYTGQNLFEEYKIDFINLLNGLKIN